MDRADWHRLRREPLRAGVAPRRAAGLLRKLSDHHADLRELRSPASRWPWAVYGLAPALVLAGCVVAVVLITALAAHSGFELPTTVQAGRGVLFGWVNLGLPVLIAVAVLINARRQACTGSLAHPRNVPGDRHRGGADDRCSLARRGGL